MSYRNDTNVPYDLSILSTLAERQGDHNVDLLDEGRDRTAANPPDRQPGATDGYSPGAVALARKEGLTENGSHVAKKAPWYRTRWGITTIFIIIILIIGGVVGGAVGAQHSSSHNSNGNNGSNVVGPSRASGTTGGSLGTPGLTSTTAIIPGETPPLASSTILPGIGQGPPQPSSLTTTVGQ